MSKTDVNQSDFFVAINSPVEHRRNILECSRNVIESLKKFQSLESLKNERYNEMSSLKSNIKELNKMLSKLKSKLPKTKLKIKSISVPVKVIKANAQEKTSVRPDKKQEDNKKELTEVERLERELDDIESKLNQIS